MGNKGENICGTEETVSVSARVTDLDMWKTLPDIYTRTETNIGSQWIVTASMKRGDIESVLLLPFVNSLQIATRLRTMDK
jgi:glutaredoxin-related protein